MWDGHRGRVRLQTAELYLLPGGPAMASIFSTLGPTKNGAYPIPGQPSRQVRSPLISSDEEIRRKMFYEVSYQLCILGHGNRPIPACFVFLQETRVLHDKAGINFYRINPDNRYQAGGLYHLAPGLIRQAHYKKHAHQYPTPMCLTDDADGLSHPMMAEHTLNRMIMHALLTYLKPYLIALTHIITQQVKHLIRQTIRPRANSQANHIRMIQCLVEYFLQFRDREICVRPKGYVDIKLLPCALVPVILNLISYLLLYPCVITRLNDSYVNCLAKFGQ